MLVLKRKVGEVIRIGDDVELYVLAVDGDVIKLGFEAPKSVQIMRSELYDAIRNENVQAGMNREEQKALLHLMGSRQKNERE
ncbi:MAG: carbon storage regulator CsrA [Candidatus Pristimantibacillus sp.]